MEYDSGNIWNALFGSSVFYQMPWPTVGRPAATHYGTWTVVAGTASNGYEWYWYCVDPCANGSWSSGNTMWYYGNDAPTGGVGVTIAPSGAVSMWYAGSVPASTSAPCAGYTGPDAGCVYVAHSQTLGVNGIGAGYSAVMCCASLSTSGVKAMQYQDNGGRVS